MPYSSASGHAPDAGVVAGEEVGGQAEDGVVGLFDDFLLGLEAEQRRDRAEGFLGGEAHGLGDVAHHGGFEEGAAQRVMLAADDDLGAVRGGVGDVLLHLLDGVGVDQRTCVTPSPKPSPTFMAWTLATRRLVTSSYTPAWM